MTTRHRAKSALRRRRLEVVLPRQRRLSALRHCRLRRFRLPPQIESTHGVAGPDTFLVELDYVVNRARFAYGEGDWNPLVVALREQLAAPETVYEQSVLARYYEKFQPATVHEILLGPPQPGRVTGYWPAADPLLDVWSVTEAHVARVLASYKQRGERWPSQFFGPNTSPHGKDHLDRALLIYWSVTETGYRPVAFEDGVATGYFLVDGDDYRVVVGHGNHRMASLTVAGVERVPIRLRLPHPPVVDRAELRRWSVDGGGLFSSSEASALFESYFRKDGLERARALGLA